MHKVVNIKEVSELFQGCRTQREDETDGVPLAVVPKQRSRRHPTTSATLPPPLAPQRRGPAVHQPPYPAPPSSAALQARHFFRG